jgi:hypothetical protein
LRGHVGHLPICQAASLTSSSDKIPRKCRHRPRYRVAPRSFYWTPDKRDAAVDNADYTLV